MVTNLETINPADITHSGITILSAHPCNPLSEKELLDHLMHAFDEPLDYPSLSNATVPGDRVAIAVQQGIPCVKQILAGTLAALSHAGIDEENITVLVTSQHLRSELQEAAGSQIAVIEHVPNSSEQLALLGVTEAGDPLRLNRVLSDADLVLSIGPAQGEQSCDRLMARILPTFSDLETLGRFQSPRSGDTAGKRAVLAKESDTCDWLLGLGLALQVVPGPEGTVVRCFCGTPLAAARRSTESYREIWRHSLPKRADLVVASICGDKSQQNWNALSRALSAAEALVESKGAIALCSEIGSPLGPSLRRMLDAADLSLVEKKLKRDQFEDSIFALQLCRVLQQHTVYLASTVDPTTVERLGLAPIANDSELRRLIKTHRNCILLHDAQYLEAAFSDDE
ncbi:lactate racemase domain-containing protein [Bythopirellula polymerisocia]|uniref:LarA-like N-terminal domain-containing protein n=1 Tax=Bythopirellula polymerisocia TaxID=2528003 RepID=A0A5C6CYM2_9BACT|nr:lactate racemase domain-containing protein [Bythopirellula polymerisocia]TWU28571.1 hypothetical protein Pla144_18620 [Bythopirellula polymerisocia]